MKIKVSEILRKVVPVDDLPVEEISEKILADGIELLGADQLYVKSDGKYLAIEQMHIQSDQGSWYINSLTATPQGE